MLESYDDNSDTKSTLKLDKIVISVIIVCPIDTGSAQDLSNMLLLMPINLNVTIVKTEFAFASYEE